MTQPDDEVPHRLSQEGGGLNGTFRRWGIVLIVAAYVLFPVASGAWFEQRIECIYPWSEAGKNGLSLAAYLGLGLWVWRRFRPDVITDDGYFFGWIIVAAAGLLFGTNVIYKCW
jgi:hypothetical protein